MSNPKVTVGCLLLIDLLEGEELLPKFPSISVDLLDESYWKIQLQIGGGYL